MQSIVLLLQNLQKYVHVHVHVILLCYRCTVLYLFNLEDVFVEVLLQLLVSIVDTKLLKGVLLEHLKTKDVQDTNGVALK